MQMIRDFYLKSYWFWVISKIILVVLLLISTLSLLGLGDLRTEELWTNLIGLFEAVLLGIILIQEFLIKSKPKFLRTIAGIILILFGIGLLVALIYVSEGSRSNFYILGYPFAIWMILTGIFDTMRIERVDTLK